MAAKHCFLMKQSQLQESALNLATILSAKPINLVCCIFRPAFGVYKLEKPDFSGKKTLDQRFGENLKNCFLQKFSANLLFFVFFSFLPQKTLKIKILISVWSVLPPIAGRNIQHWSQ